MRRMTPKQERFCQLYVQIGNASEAYRQSYDCSRMKSETIHRCAHELLQNPKITARITQLRDLAQIASGVTVERVVQGLFSEATNQESPPSARVQAWSLLGKHLGMFRESTPDRDTTTIQIREVVVHMPALDGQPAMIEGECRDVTDTDT